MSTRYDFGSHNLFIEKAFTEGVASPFSDPINNLSAPLFRLRRAIADAMEWNEDSAVSGALKQCAKLVENLEIAIADIDQAKEGGLLKTKSMCLPFVAAMYDELVKSTCDWTLAEQKLQEVTRNERLALRATRNEVELLKSQADQRLREHDQKNPVLRARVLALTDGKCAYCSTPISDEDDGTEGFAIEHVVAKDNGGPDHFANYVPSCRSCNSKKRTAHVLEFIHYRLGIARPEVADVEPPIDAPVVLLDAAE